MDTNVQFQIWEQIQTSLWD